ncbi:MAG: Type 1 glutamine amidotransferase-like domain-containing protein [Bacilli bacterium]|nr:Type 1 glutamine amidotransferase-like domain-containing protein [Bacilli bacterium]
MAIKENFDISKIEEELTNKLESAGFEITFDDEVTQDSSLNIYLTSYGLDCRYGFLNSYDSIINLLKDHKVAIINNAKLESEDRTTAQVAKYEMKKNKIEAKVIDLNHSRFNLSDFDAIYFSGGEPKYLMDAIISNNLFEDFDDFFRSGGLVIGQSAGAMIFNHEYLDTSEQVLRIQNNGFDYSDKIIVPHYDHLSNDIINNLPKSILAIRDIDDLIKL